VGVSGPEAVASGSPLPATAGQLRAAAARFGTPIGITAVAALEAAAAELRAAFPDPWLRAYSLKANDVPAVVERLGGMGLDANVVSRGEWAAARKAGLPNRRITLEGIGKSAGDLRAAVRAAADGAPLRWVAVESADELEALAAMAGRAGLGRDGRARLDVLLRLNPAVTPETHAGLAVGHEASKFGMTETELTGAVAETPEDGPLAIRGVHLHVGSQLGAVDAWRDAVRWGLALLGLLAAGRAGMDTLDVGGGFPVGAPGSVPPPSRFAEEAGRLLAALPAERRPARLATEPGRFLVARSGVIVARVLHVRDRAGWGRVVVVDAGMTELIRPMLYGAHHGIAALTSLGRPVVPDGPVLDVGPVRVDGPVCEGTDTFGLHDLPPLRRGDLVAIADTGAYAASMAMTYNGRPAIPQVLLEADGALALGRARGRASGW